MTTLREKIGEHILSFCEERELGDCSLTRHKNKKEVIDAILEAVREELPAVKTSSPFKDHLSERAEMRALGWNRYRSAVLKVLEGR